MVGIVDILGEIKVASFSSDFYFSRIQRASGFSSIARPLNKQTPLSYIKWFTESIKGEKNAWIRRWKFSHSPVLRGCQNESLETLENWLSRENVHIFQRKKKKEKNFMRVIKPVSRNGRDGLSQRVKYNVWEFCICRTSDASKSLQLGRSFEAYFPMYFLSLSLPLSILATRDVRCKFSSTISTRCFILIHTRRI